jgi:hypothetical protein
LIRIARDVGKLARSTFVPPAIAAGETLASIARISRARLTGCLGDCCFDLGRLVYDGRDRLHAE